MTHGLAAGNATYTTNAGGRLHLTDGAGDLGPQQVDLVVELVQGERPQSWIRLGEEPNNAGSGSEANHDDGSGAVGGCDAGEVVPAVLRWWEGCWLRKQAEGDGAMWRRPRSLRR